MTKFKIFATLIVFVFVGALGYLYVSHEGYQAELGDSVLFDYSYAAPAPVEEGDPEEGSIQEGTSPVKIIIGQYPEKDQEKYDLLMGKKAGDVIEITYPEDSQLVKGVSSYTGTITKVAKCSSTDITKCTLSESE
ncbi:MAG: hypothetical protein ACRC5R_01255 [Mycoplasmatales bacterium]